MLRIRQRNYIEIFHVKTDVYAILSTGEKSIDINDIHIIKYRRLYFILKESISVFSRRRTSPA